MQILDKNTNTGNKLVRSERTGEEPEKQSKSKKNVEGKRKASSKEKNTPTILFLNLVPNAGHWFQY